MARIIRITFDRHSASDSEDYEAGWKNEEGIEFDSPSQAIKFLRSRYANEASDSSFNPGTYYSSESEEDSEGYFYRESFHLDGFTERAKRMVWDALVG